MSSGCEGEIESKVHLVGASGGESEESEHVGTGKLLTAQN